MNRPNDRFGPFLEHTLYPFQPDEHRLIAELQKELLRYVDNYKYRRDMRPASQTFHNHYLHDNATFWDYNRYLYAIWDFLDVPEGGVDAPRVKTVYDALLDYELCRQYHVQ